MKKLLLIFFAIIVCAKMTFAESGTCGTNVTWTLTDSVLTISGSGAMTNYESRSDQPWYSSCQAINKVVITQGVTSIGKYVFAYCSNITSVTIPNSVQSIGAYAFQYCSKLNKITIPNSVTSIDVVAFSFSGLKSITIPNGITRIKKSTFSSCSGLTSVTIPNSVTAIEQGAFGECSSLATVTIPNSVTTIGDGAFINCTKLKNLTIGSGVTSIGTRSFAYCILTSITCYAVTPPTLAEASWGNGNNTFYNVSNPNLKNLYVPSVSVSTYKKKSTWKEFNVQALPTYTITWKQDNGTTINQTTVEQGTIPTHADPTKSATAEYSYTFAGWTPTIVAATANATYTATYTATKRKYTITFNNYDNTQLQSSSVEYGTVPSYTSGTPTKPATAEYTYTFKVWFPEVVAVTGNATYTAVYDSIPRCPTASGTCGADGDNLIWELGCDSVLTISGTGNMKAYASTSQIPWYIHKESIKEIVLGDSVTNIGKKAFQDCTNLTSVTIGNSITSIGDYAFRGCSSLTSIEIPKGVTSIGTAVFGNCSRLTSIVWKARTMSSSGAIFSDIDEQITSFVFGDEVEEIPSMCCVDMFNLISISIPNSVISIGDRAFGGCYSLGNIYVYWIEPINISGIFDSETHNSANLHVPCRAIAAYRAAEGWKDFNNIVGMDCATYAITWQNYDGSILATDSVLENELPQYTESNPTKPATVEYSYTFTGWTPEVVPVTGDAIYTAHFDSAKVVYDVDITIPDSIESHGSVTVDGEPTYGDTIIVTAVPDDGYYFDGWSDGNTDNPREIEITGDTAVYPIFKECEERITYLTETIYKGQSFAFGGQELTTRGTYRDTIVLANGCDSIIVLKLNVLNSKVKFNLRVVVNDETMGTVSGTGAYVSGSEVTITATPASSKYIFVRWYNEDEDIDVYENPYTFTLTRNLQLRAVFRKAPRKTPKANNKYK